MLLFIIAIASTIFVGDFLFVFVVFFFFKKKNLHIVDFWFSVWLYFYMHIKLLKDKSFFSSLGTTTAKCSVL